MVFKSQNLLSNSLDKNTPPCAGTTFFLMDAEGVQQAGLGQQGIF